MRVRLAVAILLMLGGPAAAEQATGPVGSPERDWRGQIHMVPLDIAGQRTLLYTRICRPAGETPGRLVVIAHGAPPREAVRAAMTPAPCDSEAARWFLERGYVVLAGMRRGYGKTGGKWAENDGACGNRDYTRSGLEAAKDIAAMIEYAISLPYVRPNQAVVIGQSAGGWGAIAYNSLPHPQVVAFVSIAGGVGGHYRDQPNAVCQPDKLAEGAGKLARGASTPMLWIYSRNDTFYGPPIAAAMHKAYSSNGGKAELAQLAAFGTEGNRLFFEPGGSQAWGPLVERYLSGRFLQADWGRRQIEDEPCPSC